MSKGYSSGHRQMPLDPPADALALDAMAVVAAFAEAYERGEAPLLSEWLRRYPEHATVLADYAAAMSAEQGVIVEDTGAEQELSPGTLRALDKIAGGTFAGETQAALPRVAEHPANYDAGTPDREK